MCFVRTEPLHFDPVVPSNYLGGISINTYSDSDASIVITDELNEDDDVETKGIKTEIPSTNMDTDFFMDSLVMVMNKMKGKFHSIMSHRLFR